MTGSDYRPIDCGVHDRLESFAVKGTLCRVTYAKADGGEGVASGRIRDVFARSGAEFLLMDDGTELRLDRLRSVEPA